jgi:hypothetical protein
MNSEERQMIAAKFLKTIQDSKEPLEKICRNMVPILCNNIVEGLKFMGPQILSFCEKDGLFVDLTAEEIGEISNELVLPACIALFEDIFQEAMKSVATSSTIKVFKQDEADDDSVISPSSRVLH